MTKYKIRKDSHLKANKIVGAKLKKLKNKRIEFNDKQKQILEKTKNKRTTKRNISTLSKRQLRIKNKRNDKAVKRRAKLKYKKTGGDIAFREILANTKWTDNFVSSNVWKFKVKGNNLMIMYLDGSVYIYFGVAKQFLGLYNVGSKGKWVWRKLIRPNVNYAKIR